MLGDGDASDGKRCAAVESILDLAGKGETQSDGTALLRLNDFHCIEPPVGRGLSYEYPVTVVATPRDGTPVHLAVEAQIVDVQGEADVHITVRSWDTNGAPVSARFDWRCAVPFHPTF